MAGRIRTIKPEWIEDERFNACSDAAIRMAKVFYALVDDDGRCKASVRALGLSGWKFCDRVTDKTAHAAAAVAELIECRWLVGYEVGGEQFWSVRTFSVHQRISHYTASKLPPPPEDSGALASPAEVSGVRRPDLDLDLDLEGKGSGVGEGGVPALTKPIPLDARISHSDAQDTFGRLRVAHGGGPFKASQREYTRVSELADFANSQGSTREARVAALEATIRGYLAHADAWCTERGFPITGMHDFGVCLARGVTVAPKAPAREPSTPREKLVAERDKLRPLRNGQRLCSQEESDRIDRRWAEVEDAIDAIDGVTR